ncbi:MAG: lipoyl synthase, partial [Candidatus Cloacimonetes bacterium]|nr:lipoyl synthase [Candidatus Cloacimonadota bacterium]
PNPEEPEAIARLVTELGLRYVVITTVTRDDIPDGGAAHFVKTIQAVRATNSVSVEVLISDLQGDESALRTILTATPDVLNHNMETVRRLYSEVRPQADYDRSLELLARVRSFCPEMITKSGIMVGLGETPEEVTTLMRDLRDINVNILTIGQYIAPTRQHYPVSEYITPEQFDKYRDTGLKLGFSMVMSGPLVRSSYNAEEAEKLFKRRQAKI